MKWQQRRRWAARQASRDCRRAGDLVPGLTSASPLDAGLLLACCGSRWFRCDWLPIAFPALADFDDAEFEWDDGDARWVDGELLQQCS